MTGFCSAQESSLFFKLPAEIRNRIYGYSFDEEVVKFGQVLENSVEAEYPRGWNIVTSCKLAYSESRALFYILSLFDCNGNLTPLQFLTFVPGFAKKYIQHVFGVRPSSIYALRELISRLTNIRTVGCYAGAMELSAPESQVFVGHNDLNYRSLYNFIMQDAPDMSIVASVGEWIQTINFLISTDIRLNIPDFDAISSLRTQPRSISMFQAERDPAEIRRHNVSVRDSRPADRRFRIVRMMLCFDLTRQLKLVRARQNVLPGQQEIDIHLWLRNRPHNPIPWVSPEDPLPEIIDSSMS